MSGHVLDTLLLKLRARDEISDEEERVLKEAISDCKEIGAGRVVVRAATVQNECTLLVDGIAARFKDLADGQRQILELHVSGDFIDLHSFVLKRIEHNLGTLSPCKFAMMPHDRVRRISEEYPHLARMLWTSTVLDAALHREKILSIGRRSAHSRIAHLVCELYVRLQLVGLASDYTYALPVTQADLADATGLTAVHVNRMLRKLRDEGLVTFRSGKVRIQDWDRLQRVAEFDPAYLFLERRPR